jgi:FtsH-binding integral membrane protein
MYQSPQRSEAFAASTGTLLGHVLAITGSGFVITAAAAYLTAALGIGTGPSLVAMLVGFGFLIAIQATRNNEALSLLMFYLFTLCEGVGIGPVIGYYLALDGPGVVVDSAATTGLGMLALAAIVYLTSFDYRRLSGIAFGALILLVLVGLISIFVRFVQPQTYAWLTLAIFSVLVLVDFARVKAGGDGLNAVQIATSIYLDAINIFLALCQIFGGRRRN